MNEEHLKRYAQIYQFGVLRPDRDRQLVLNIDKFAKTAGIPSFYIYQSLYDFVEENGIIDWMMSFKAHPRRGIFGACILDGKDILTKMSAITGCAVRNYIDGRLLSIQEIINIKKSGGSIDADLVVVPNFFVSLSEGGSIPKWESSVLLGFLYERHVANQQTVVYVSSLKMLANSYGDAFSQFIQKHYTIIA